MSQQSGSHLRSWFGRPVLAFLVLSVFGVPVPVVANDGAATEIARQPLMPHASSAPIPQTGMFGWSIATEARRLAASAPQDDANTNSGSERSWAGRHPIVLGTLIGLGIGLANEATQCAANVQIVPHSGEGLPCDGRVAAAVAGVSAGIGAGIGAITAIFLR